MNEARRQAYLDALDITQFIRRDVSRMADPGDVPPETAVEAQQDRPASRETRPPRPESSPGDVVAPAVPVEEPATDGDGRTGGLQTDWSALQAQVEHCQACELCKTRTQTVFSAGNPQADVMIIGEAPGADEDRLGEPFVGRAGQLLNAMLKAIGQERETVCIANILKCRPPGNRNPSVSEVAACRPYLDRQIQLVQPKVILSVGAVSAQNLLHSDESVGRLRRRSHVYGKQRIPLLVTYHPAYLLRRPEEKAKSWEDLQRLAGFLS